MDVTPLRRGARWIWLTVPLTIGLAACGGSSNANSSAKTSATTPARVSRVASRAASLAKGYSTRPATIGITQPVGKSIPAGKRIVLIGAGPSGEGTILTYQGFDQAAKVLGWHAKTIQPQAPTPQDLQQALEEAIRSHPAGVAIAAIPEAAVTSQLRQLKAMHIPVISTTGPDPTGGLLTLQIMGVPGLSQKAAAVATKVVADMHGPGEIGMVGIEGYQIIEDYSQAFRAKVNALCSSCRIKQTILPLASLGTSDGQDIVNFLRGNPGIKALFVGYDGLDTNLVSAAEQAGVTLPKTYSVAVLPEDISMLRSGKLTATSPLDFAEIGWQMADAFARMFTGQMASALKLDSRNEPPTIWSQGSGNVPASPSANAFPSVVNNYQARFEKLWGK